MQPSAGPVLSKDDFLEKFGDMRTSEQVRVSRLSTSSTRASYNSIISVQVTELRRVLKPYLLRRLKEDVHASLPPKEETIIEVEMTSVQKQYYRAIYEHNAAFLVGGGSQVQAPSLMNIVMVSHAACGDLAT
jgi:SNF2 family DNA or RNA helicase